MADIGILLRGHAGAGGSQVPEVEVSVIVPVYNVRPVIATLLESLAATTLSRVEFVVVVDGSTDGSGAVCDEYARRDARFRVVHQCNAGPSAARNTALALARGAWIAFADGDDWVAPEALETWLKTAQALALDILVGNSFRFSGDVPAPEARVPMLAAQPWGQTLTGTDWIIHAAANDEWPHYVWLQLVRRELIGELTFIDGLLHEDVTWTLSLALRAQRMGFDPVPRYGYRGSPASLTSTPTQAVALLRANSYLQIVDIVSGAAAEAGACPHLARALRRHAHREVRHLFGLIRKLINDSPERAWLVERSLRRPMLRALFGGVHSAHSLWFALRAFATLHLLRLRERSRLFQRSVVTQPVTGMQSPPM